MAPIPTTNTARLVVNYVDGDSPHQFQVRYVSAAAAVASIPTWENWLDSFAANHLSTEWSTVGADVYETGQSFSTPTAFPIVQGGTVPNTEVSDPRFLSFIGRSSGGRRCRVYLYGGTGFATAVDYRFSPSDDANIDTIRQNFVTAFTSTGAVAVDGAPVSWKTYTNVGFNSYWQRVQRGG